MIENEEKAKYFANHLGCNIELPYEGIDKLSVTTLEFIFNDADGKGCLLLTSLEQISDEDAIEVAKIAHQMPKGNFKVVKRSNSPFCIHIEKFDNNIDAVYHVSINAYGCVNVNIHFNKDENSEASSHKINIGEINISSKIPIPYLFIVDYLRSKSYATQWNGYTVESLIKKGWLKLK